MSLESKIDELIAALDRNTAAQVGVDTTDSPATAGEPAKRGRKPKTATEPAPPAATTSPPATAPAATGVASATAPTPPPQAVLTQATEAVIKLANEYSRDKAVGILSKVRGDRKGVTRCSDLSPLDWVDVLNEATAAIAQAESEKAATKANASLV